MTKQTDRPVTFFIGENQDVEWLYREGNPDLTVEQAMVIVHARGLHKIAAAIENLALAIDAVAEKLPDRDSG